MRDSGFFFAAASTLWKHRGLLWRFTQRNVELRHRGSHLGIVWAILNPLLTLSLYVFIFGYIFNGSFRVLPNETKLDYALAIFLGLAIYQFLSEVLGVSTGVIVANPNLVKKVVFPLEILPAALVGSAFFHTLISLALVLVGVAAFGPGLSWDALWLPVILLPMIPLALGIAWFFAALGVFLRDINQIIGLATMALMYASALFFPVSAIPPQAWTFLRLNPLLLTVELARDAVLWHRPMDPAHLAYVAGFSLVTCVAGFLFFKKTSPAFADVL